MQKWEYLRMRLDEFTHYVIGPSGDYFTTEQLSQMDPDGKYQNIHHWGIADRQTLLRKLFNQLGDEGWEAVGKIGPGTQDTMLFKRPVAN